MQTRRLGRTNLEVTVIGLGGAPIGRENCSAEDASGTVWVSIEGGMTLVDTSPHYGLGRSEERIGRALRERPDLAEKVILSTKTGHYVTERDYSYDRTMRSVETSLQRLGVSYLPIVHIHDIQTADELDAMMGDKAALTALCELKAQGVVGNIGLGTKGLGALDRALDSGHFDVLMMANQYNLVEQAGAHIIERARELDVGVIIAGAYATGILVKGSAHPDARYQYRPASSSVRSHVAAVERLCARWGCSLPTVAVQFCLRASRDWPVAVLGARTAEQTQTNLATVHETVPDGLWPELEALLASAGPVDVA